MLDFCMDKRDRVITWRAPTAAIRSPQIITYGSMAAKAVVRDVGRVLGHPYGFTDRVLEIGMRPEKLHRRRARDLKQAYETDEEVTELITMARKLEGVSAQRRQACGWW